MSAGISTRFAMSKTDGTNQTFLPRPGRGIGRELTRIGGSHISINGSQTVDVINRKWAFTLPFVWLSATEYGLIIPFVDGTRGLGPFRFTQDAWTSFKTVNIVSFTENIQLWGQYNAELQLSEV